MNLDPEDLDTPTLTHAEGIGSNRRTPDEADCPEVVTHGDRRVLFGPGLDDFNALDDPC